MILSVASLASLFSGACIEPQRDYAPPWRKLTRRSDPWYVVVLRTPPLFPQPAPKPKGRVLDLAYYIGPALLKGV